MRLKLSDMSKRKINTDAAFVGIDPDKDKTGVAVINGDTIRIYNGSFCEVYNSIIGLCRVSSAPVRVYVEGSWKTRGNWHLGGCPSMFVASKIGYNIGENHTVGRLLYELLESSGIEVEATQPLTKLWPNRSKVTHAALCQQLDYFGIKGMPKRSNPEQRDAALIALWYAMM